MMDQSPEWNNFLTLHARPVEILDEWRQNGFLRRLIQDSFDGYLKVVHFDGTKWAPSSVTVKERIRQLVIMAAQSEPNPPLDRPSPHVVEQAATLLVER